jgi:Right handed beta helix region
MAMVRCCKASILSPFVASVREAPLDPNAKQPNGLRSRLTLLRPSRDSMILVAALAFLALTILLAIFFPSNTPNDQPTTGTAVAQGGTAAAHPDMTASAIARGTTTESASPFPPAESPTQPLAGYPGPVTATVEGGDQGESDLSDATQTSEAARDATTPDDALQPSSDLPTFAPNRPTSSSDEVVPTSEDNSLGQPPATVPAPNTDDLQPPATDTEVPTEDSATEPDPTELPTPRPPSAPPTARPSAGGASGPAPATPAAAVEPAPAAVDVLRGNIHWTAAQSPIILNRDQQLAAGASLVIEPGVEVRLAQGVSFFVDGTLYALGQPDRPVRFVSSGQRWEGLFGRPGSNIALEHTEIHGGGAGGTLLTSSSGNLVLHSVHLNDNGGHIEVNNSHLEMSNSEIAGNDMPYGAALEASYSNGGSVTLNNNRIGGNRMSPGAPPVMITNQSTSDVVKLDIQRNLLIGQDGPDLVLSTNGPFQGSLTCNALLNGANGLSIRSQTPQIPGFDLSVHDNMLADHTPPIIPIYLQYGIGRGATSEIALDMRNNWWGSALGPYHPDLHGDGRGEAVGDNITFAPWLMARPACAPQP